MIKYEIPKNWIKYDFTDILNELVEAKSAINALKAIPYQRSWVENLQQIQLKREVAGTSQIEGADFTERELDEALKENPEQLITRSQKQAHAAGQTYRWIFRIPDNQPLNADLIKEIHRKIVTGADDDHCEPGKLRQTGQNVNFGQPRHRGANGGKECNDAFDSFTRALQHEYQGHDFIIQALTAHYHIAAMHPFLDGNGRTARALEALLLQRAGLRDPIFISLSNYYYDEKTAYLNSLNDSCSNNHNITPFLKFGLKGVAQQCNRLIDEIKTQMQKAIFRNVMHDLFGRLETKRKRVIAKRQLVILNLLLENDQMKGLELFNRTAAHYSTLSNPIKAFIRDISGLIELKAIAIYEDDKSINFFVINLEWPTEITETKFFELIKSLPKARTYKFLQ